MASLDEILPLIDALDDPDQCRAVCSNAEERAKVIREAREQAQAAARWAKLADVITKMKREAAELSDAYNTFNAELKKVDEAVRSLPFKQSTIVQIGTDNRGSHRLAFARDPDAGWGLRIVTLKEGEDPRNCPILNAPRDLRILAVAHLEALLVAAILEIRRESVRVREAADNVANCVATIREQVPADEREPIAAPEVVVRRARAPRS